MPQPFCRRSQSKERTSLGINSRRSRTHPSQQRLRRTKLSTTCWPHRPTTRQKLKPAATGKLKHAPPSHDLHRKTWEKRLGECKATKKKNSWPTKAASTADKTVYNLLAYHTSKTHASSYRETQTRTAQPQPPQKDMRKTPRGMQGNEEKKNHGQPKQQSKRPPFQGRQQPRPLRDPNNPQQ